MSKNAAQHLFVCVLSLNKYEFMLISREQLRVERPHFHIDNTVEVTAASDRDSSLWRCFGQVRLRRSTWQIQNLLEGLLIPAGPETPQDPPPEELEDVARAALHSLLPPQKSDLSEQPTLNR